MQVENTGGATGWCLEPHDLAYSKLAVAREKDLTFVRNLLIYKLVKPSLIQNLIDAAKDDELRAKLDRAFELCRPS